MVTEPTERHRRRKRILISAIRYLSDDLIAVGWVSSNAAVSLWFGFNLVLDDLLRCRLQHPNLNNSYLKLPEFSRVQLMVQTSKYISSRYCSSSESLMFTKKNTKQHWRDPMVTLNTPLRLKCIGFRSLKVAIGKTSVKPQPT
jgi:hypothetical protein